MSFSHERDKRERIAAAELLGHYTRPVAKRSGHCFTIWASGGRLGLISKGDPLFYPMRRFPDFGELMPADIGKQIHRIGTGAAAFYQVESGDQMAARLAKLSGRTQACFDAIRRDLDSAACNNPALSYANATQEESS